jgi:hypothetical protein
VASSICQEPGDREPGDLCYIDPSSSKRQLSNVNDAEATPHRLTVVYSRQSRATGAHFSSCEAQYGICKDTADSMGWPVHDHFLDEGESSETLRRPAEEEKVSGTVND